MDIKNKTQFIEYFSEGIKDLNQLKIGVEHERFLFEGQSKKRISYQTLKILFKNLKSNGWQPRYEKENINGMKRGNQQITTEPGLQCELSGAPLENIHQVCGESSKFLKEIESASKGLDISTVSIGFDPFNNLADVPKSSKTRYKIMTNEMPKTGKESLEMMYRTCSIQLNYDYTSESNFEKIFRLVNYLTPLTIALYSNSPFESGKPTGYYSYRNKVWQNTSRGGIMPIAFEQMTFEKYFDHIKPRGKYDGFLLSKANCFGKVLREILKEVEKNNFEKAENLSKKLSDIIRGSFDKVEKLNFGNHF